MPKCTVCHHPQHLEINQALLSKDLTLAALSQKFGLHPSSLQRHKNHIEVNMSRTHRRLREIREQGSLLLLNDILEQVRRNIAVADSEGNYLAVFRGSHVASRIIHQLGRLEGDMQLDTLHRLISSPAWTPQAGLLPTDPALITALHQALVDGASVPCPEAPPDSPDQTAAEDDYPAPAGPDIAVLRRLQELLPDLDLTLDDLMPETEELPKNNRKISEKSAPNIPPNTDKCLQYQKPKPSEKNFPKNPAGAPKTAAPAAIFATDSPADAASVGRENEVHPAFLESAAPPAVSGISCDPSTPTPETVPGAPEPLFPEPPADPPETNEPQETLDEAQAAELAAYLKDFPPYASQDHNPDPCPSNPSSQIPDPCPAKPPLSPAPHTPPGSGPGRPPDFGNPGLFRQIKGTFC